MPVINTNVAAIKARSNFDRTQREMDRSITRLSSGLKINTAADDASGFAIAGKMESQIRGLGMVTKNIKDAKSYVDTMEGALQEVSALLQRMRELAVQASSGVTTVTDNGYLQLEMDQLINEIDAIADNTKFNGASVLSSGGVLSFFSDINVTGNTAVIVTADMHISVLGITGNDVSVATLSMAQSAINNIDDAIAIVDNRRASVGAISNRFNHTIDNLTNVIANTEAAKSRIVDADYASETTALTRNSILQQAATSMIAQANANKSYILSLISS